jgi:phospholipase/carboxylesterase
MNALKPYTLGALERDAAAALSFRVRQSAPAQPGRCLVLLHGVGGNETNLLSLADGVAQDTLVVFVQGPLALGPGQFAWFRVAFTEQGPRIVPEEAESSRKALIQFLAQQQHKHGIEPGHTVIAGFSQGGIMSAGVALSAPQSVAGFGLLSGRILPELQPHIASRDALAGLSAFVGHGEYDSKLPVDWAHKSDALLRELGVAHTLQLYPIDHGISPDMQNDFLEWLAELK